MKVMVLMLAVVAVWVGAWVVLVLVLFFPDDAVGFEGNVVAYIVDFVAGVDYNGDGADIDVVVDGGGAACVAVVGEVVVALVVYFV
ncbi:hypothetical protein ElyMa_005384800 [Elysia marginata]|uniref:Transmembrane protein n=1 Tax=Elysia marginata TaxID=1093978 RepID=A0AAV4EFE4_9GAST|nr:hypothetical protein ElyMa_005384800 [Elysia marginata]